jgi:hypothetical protein
MTRVRLAAAIQGALLAIVLIGPRPVVAAAPSSLELTTDAVIEVGVHPTVDVRLTAGSVPIAGATVEVRLDGRQTKRVVTDDDGRASTVLARDLAVGNYELQAVFRGDAAHLASVSAVATVQVTPAHLTVRTIPPLPNVALLRVDGGPLLTTGDDGTISIPISSVRRYRFEAVLPPAAPDRRLAFDRWSDGSRDTSLSVRLPGRDDLAIGLQVSYPVAFEYLDSTGVRVDLSRLERLRIASDRGETLDLEDRALTWLPANEIVRRAGGLTSVPIEYRVLEATVRGSNVVDRGRLHFQPDGDLTTWVIPLLLYSLTVSGQDALFGFPLGRSVQLQYPDGTSESVPLDERASATIAALPRGNYRVVVERPEGIAVSTPVVLTRDQYARVPVISYLDAASVLGGGIALAVALVLFGGRPIGRFGRRVIGKSVAIVIMVLRAPVLLVLAIVRAPGVAWRALRRKLSRRSRMEPALAPTQQPAPPPAQPAPLPAHQPAPSPAQPMRPPTQTALPSIQPARASAGALTVFAGSASTAVIPFEFIAPSADRSVGRAPEDQRPLVRPIRYRRCPGCGRDVRYRARLCRACSRRLRKS